MPDPGNLYSLSFEPIKKSWVENIIKSLSLDSNLDVFDIDSTLLRITAAMLTPSVTRILNNSIPLIRELFKILVKDVPQDWKITRVTHAYKGKGYKRDRSNYRPISVLGSISMVMERKDHSQILSYFIKHNLIVMDQFAFLKTTLPHDVSFV